MGERAGSPERPGVVVGHLWRTGCPVLGHRGVALVAMALLAPPSAGLLQLALAGSRELGADRGGADLLGARRPWPGPWKVVAYARVAPMAILPCQTQAWIVNPLGPVRRWDLARLFSTHHPVAQRVARLRPAGTGTPGRSLAGRR
ncbi:MAG: hypothetical protein ACRD0J_01905 [Acidimicrobiales bacterium]